FSLAKFAADYIEQSPDFELCQRPDYLTVCFNAKDADPVQLCDLLHASGEAIIGHANVRGEKVIRLVLVNPDLETSDLLLLFENIVATRAKLISV
ncbi:MAG: hypothetical protein ACKVJZ_08355, partial [Planctomycetota bacterium]